MKTVASFQLLWLLIIGVFHCQATRARATGRSGQSTDASAENTMGRIPKQWVNVPGAPLVAEVHTKNGLPYAVLVNRSNKAVVALVLGTLESAANRIRVGCEIEEHRVGGAGSPPGAWWEGVLPRAVQKSAAMIAAEKGCTGGLNFGIVRVEFVDGTTWSATGTPADAAP